MHTHPPKTLAGAGTQVLGAATPHPIATPLQIRQAGPGRYNRKHLVMGDPMEVQEAVRAAKAHVTELFEDEEIMNVGLEEVEFKNGWRITIGFSRPWDRTILTSPGRSYKVVCLNDKTGRVVSVTDRLLNAPS